MPTGNLSLLDVVQTRNADPVTGLVEDQTIFAPEFYSLPATPRGGTNYFICKRTTLPPIQFRAVNGGVSAGKSQYHLEMRQMYFLDGAINVDEALVQQDEAQIGDLLTNEAIGILQSAVIYIGNQTYYGAGVNPLGTANTNPSADSLGFVGLRNQIAGVLAAGGTTNTSSAYLIWLGPWGVHFDVGKDGEFALKPWMRQQIANPNGAGNLFAWVSNLSSWLGLAVISNLAVWAITGIDTSSHKMTDALGAQLLSLIPVSRRNGLVWLMNRTVHYTLQVGRTVTLFGEGESRPNQGLIAPLPDECMGYPIIVTDSLLTTENNS